MLLLLLFSFFSKDALCFQHMSGFCCLEATTVNKNICPFSSRRGRFKMHMYKYNCRYRYLFIYVYVWILSQANAAKKLKQCKNNRSNFFFYKMALDGFPKQVTF